MTIEELLDLLWNDYAAITPAAAKIHALLAERGERVVNDHIALRTYSLPGMDIEDIDRAFVAAGYEPVESYRFDAKKLEACHYEHRREGLPKIFISALQVDELSPESASRIHGLAEQVESGAAADTRFAGSGRHWAIDRETYEALSAESEYAGWVAAFGFRANHFTVLVNALESFADLGELNAFLRDSGFALNQSGGEIKGSPETLLEQSSTLAEPIEVELEDATIEIPSCYYEFARRYPLPSGELFQGFVTDSADKIFESTDRR